MNESIKTSILRELRILSWAVEALDKDCSGDFVDFIQTFVLRPHLEELIDLIFCLHSKVGVSNDTK